MVNAPVLCGRCGRIEVPSLPEFCPSCKGPARWSRPSAPASGAALPDEESSLAYAALSQVIERAEELGHESVVIKTALARYLARALATSPAPVAGGLDVERLTEIILRRAPGLSGAVGAGYPSWLAGQIVAALSDTTPDRRRPLRHDPRLGRDGCR